MNNAGSDCVLVRGYLSLDIKSRVLTGPSGLTGLAPADAETLAEIMDGHLLAWPQKSFRLMPDTADLRARHKIRARVSRIRAALDRVGASPSVLHSFRGLGYGLMLREEPLVRSFVGPQIARLDRLLASHPNRQAVARLMAG